MNSMNKKTKTKPKSNGKPIIKLGPPMARAVAAEPRFVLRFLGREQVERFTVPVVVRPRPD